MYTLLTAEELGESLNAIFSFSEGVTIHIFGMNILIYNGVIFSLCAMLVITALAFLVRWHIKRADIHKRPSRVIVVAEMILDFAKTNTGDMKFARLMTPFIATFFIYLIAINTAGFWGVDPPGSNIIIAFSLGITMFLLMHILSIVALKGKYFKQYLEPLPVLLPFNLIDFVSQPITVSIRIFGNMVAGVVIALLIKFAMSMIPFGAFLTFIPLSAWSFYADLFVGCVQSLVFVMLTINYIKERLEV